MGTTYPDKIAGTEKITPVNGAFFRHLGLCYKITSWLLARRQILELSRRVTDKIARRKQQAVWIRSTLLV